MRVLGALVGVLVVAGVGLILAGLRPTERAVRPARPRPGLTLDRPGLRAGLAVVAGVVALGATGWAVGAVLAAAGGFAAPSLWGQSSGSRAGIARTEAVATWAEMLRDTLAGGGVHLGGAIVATERLAPLPIRPQVAGLVADLRDPRVRDEAALRRFAHTLADPTADVVVAALVLAITEGTRDLAALLGVLATAARAEATMRMEVEAGRARTRTSVRIIIATFAAMYLGLSVFARSYVEPYSWAWGQAVLGLIGGLSAVAFIGLYRLSRAPAPARFLAPAEVGP